jgi:hypothetical protein
MGGRLLRSASIAVLAAVTAAVVPTAASSALRIVGGTAIQVQSAPWTVFLTVTFGREPYDCTGSVIDASHILTAAHCLYNDAGTLAQPDQIAVVAGTSNYKNPPSSSLVQRATVSSFRIHPGYSFETDAPDDVAVLKLSEPLNLSGPAVRAVALPAPNTPFPTGAQIVIAGYGQENLITGPSGQLYSEVGTVYPQGACGQQVQGPLQRDNGVFICAASRRSEVCYGDSGGGVVTTGRTPVLVGVVDDAYAYCPIGQVAIFAYTGSPEILQFIRGSDDPPKAPQPSEWNSWDVTWKPPLVAGNTLRCSPGSWRGPVRADYSFVNDVTQRVLQRGARSSYLVPVRQVGARIDCIVQVSNRGGTMLVRTIPTPLVGAAPRVQIERMPPLQAQPGERVTLRVILRAPLGLVGQFRVCATLPASVGGRACLSRHESFGVSGQLEFPLSLRVKPAASPDPAPIRVRVKAGLSSATATSSLRVT